VPHLWGNIPADGSETCGKLLDRKHLQSIKNRIKVREITIDDAFSYEQERKK
jgi:hypothetical protein